MNSALDSLLIVAEYKRNPRFRSGPTRWRLGGIGGAGKISVSVFKVGGSEAIIRLILIYHKVAISS